MQLLNIFHSGLIIVPVLIFAGALAALIAAFNSAAQARKNNPKTPNISFTGSAFFWWFVALVVIGIAVTIYIANDYKGV